MYLRGNSIGTDDDDDDDDGHTLNHSSIETHPCKNSSVARESMHPMTIGAMDVIHGECNIP